MRCQRWMACEKSFMSFHFRSNRDLSLLVYSEDFEFFDFLILKLIDGRAKLHYCNGGFHYLGTCAQLLDDGNWHSIKIEVRANRFDLFVDDVSCPSKNEINEVCPLREFQRKNSFVFFGGVPDKFGSSTRMSLIKFYRKFQGTFKNVVVSQCGGKIFENFIVEDGGLRSNAEDFCVGMNPCRNGGSCVSSDFGALCECYMTSYTGTFCEKGECPEMNSIDKKYVYFSAIVVSKDS